MFEEAGDLEKDVGHLKRHVIAQRRLIQHLTDNLYSSILVAENNSKEEKIEATDASACDALDILLSEHRMDEALELLELQGQALEKMQNDGRSDSARLIASSMSALSARKARVADRFASLADNPRTPRHELLKALSGLCKLGDAQRANHLLFKFYRSSVIRHVEELRRCSKELSRERINYIKELAREVFSSILQASRSFVMLHGHPSSYTSELIRWAREEIEDFSVAFCEYARSMSQVGETSLALALDAAKCALSYCSLLRPLKIVSEEDLIDLIVPCMEEVLAMYAKHLKEVVRLFVASDSWVLGRFLISGIIQRARSPTTSAAAGQIEHCLLTTSGRKFVTLIQVRQLPLMMYK